MGGKGSDQIFLGIDVGTASVRAGIVDSRVDSRGNRLAFFVRPIQQFHRIRSATSSHQRIAPGAALSASSCATASPKILPRKNADTTGSAIHLASEEDAVTHTAVASGAFALMPVAAAQMVCPGGSIAARSEVKAFHDAKYTIYLQLYEDKERCRSAMPAWQ